MIIESDVLIIGSGIAGLSLALKLAEHANVSIITKKDKAESNTNYAQGGIAAVIDKNDNYELHIQDTLKAGAGLCHRDAVELIVYEGPKRVQELIEWGVEFSRKNPPHDNDLDLGREGGHSVNRIVHAKDLTGRAIEQSLLKAIKAHPNVKIYEQHFAIDLITEHHLPDFSGKDADQPHCWGAYVFDIKNKMIKQFLARATVLATGGSGRVYLHTTNPAIATGDGIAMAY